MTTTRLELTWPAEDKFLLVPKEDSAKPGWVERDHSAASVVRLAGFGVVGNVRAFDAAHETWAYLLAPESASSNAGLDNLAGHHSWERQVE